MRALNPILISLMLAISSQTTPATAATDGTPGATSTGTIGATVSVSLPPEATVQVFGLDDFDFGNIIADNQITTSIPEMEQQFCVEFRFRRTGSVNITIAQISGAAELLPGQFNIGDSYQFNGIPLQIKLRHNDGFRNSTDTIFPNTPIRSEAAGSLSPNTYVCSIKYLILKLSNIPVSGPGVAGVYNAQFSVLVTPL